MPLNIISNKYNQYLLAQLGFKDLNGNGYLDKNVAGEGYLAAADQGYKDKDGHISEAGNNGKLDEKEIWDYFYFQFQYKNPTKFAAIQKGIEEIIAQEKDTYLLADPDSKIYNYTQNITLSQENYFEKIAAIRKAFLALNISYDTSLTCSEKAIDVYQSKTGYCVGIATLLTTMLQKGGINSAYINIYQEDRNFDHACASYFDYNKKEFVLIDTIYPDRKQNSYDILNNYELINFDKYNIVNNKYIAIKNKSKNYEELSRHLAENTRLLEIALEVDEHFRRSPVIKEILGRTYFAKEEWAKAFNYYQEAAFYSRKDTVFIYMQSLCKDYEGNSAAALKILENYPAVKSENYDYYLRLKNSISNE
ncbi:MAG: transglutaminase-like domain-containing protein [Candidatus Margulisbacteria bacterium]|nr:transglutaminase-like domain-containing protein [Candidatus Margulisiibacteriota bacterium]